MVLMVVVLLVSAVIGVAVAVGVDWGRVAYWVGGIVAVVVGVPLLIYLGVHWWAARIEGRVVAVVDEAVAAVDLGEPVRRSHPNQKCRRGSFNEANYDFYCVDPGYPARATAVFEIDGMSNVEAITVVDEGLTEAGFRATWGPYCDHSTGMVTAVYEDPDGNGLYVIKDPNTSPPSFDPEAVWWLKFEAVVEYRSGEPLRPDDYERGPETQLALCGPGS